MIAYIEIKITRFYGKVPSSKWFASLSSDAITSGRFDETETTYEIVDCDDSFDVQQEVKRRREKLIDKYTDKHVWFDVHSISKHEFKLLCVKNKDFENSFAG